MDMERRFQFGHLPKVVVGHLETPATKNLLSKWSMKDGLKVQAFHFDRDFKPYLIDEFLQDFFGSLQVMGCLQRIQSSQQFSPIGIQAESIKFQRVRSTLTTTELFDRLLQQEEEDDCEQKFRPIVRSSGSIIKRIPDYFQADPTIHDPTSPPIEVGDELRKLVLQGFLDPQSDFGDNFGDEMSAIFSEEEKDEFLYRLFTHFVIGGSLCQYEDNVSPYIDMTRSLYKQLMTVGSATGNLSAKDEPATDEKTNKVAVIKSVVIKVNCLKNENYSQEDLLFSNVHLNNFFYIIVQPVDHTLFTLYHQVL